MTYNNFACLFRKTNKLRNALSYLEMALEMEYNCLNSKNIENTGGTRSIPGVHLPGIYPLKNNYTDNLLCLNIMNTDMEAMNESQGFMREKY